jgi:cytochrome c-type biogenesis protein CcmH
MIRIQKPVLILAMVFLAGIAAVESAYAGAMLADLENALMCKCDDKCGKVLINCTCSTSDETRKKFTKLLDSGLTVEQIIQQQVEKHGETILSAPTKKGFNLTAWVIPFGALLVGGLGLRRLIKTWTGKNNSGKKAPEGEGEKIFSTTPNKYSRQLQDELDRLEL